MQGFWRYHHMIFTWTLLTTSVIVLSMPSSPLEESISDGIYPPHDINMRSRYHLCGKKLTNTLHAVCRGLYNPMFKKNDEEARSPSPKREEQSSPFRTKMSATSLISGGTLRRRTRGVYDECCRKWCTFSELTSYCGR